MRHLLQGIRVLDSAILLGATTGMHLADLGADVIKIESPFRGDYQRDFLGQITPHHSPTYLQCNRNKRSLTLNVRSAEGKEIFFRLLGGADVFIDGFPTGQLDRLGIGYDEQRKVKPDIIYCQVTGFGSTGPLATLPTHAYMMNALAAAIPVAIDDDGAVRPTASEDVFDGTVGGNAMTSAAAYATAYILAALVARDRTGEGTRLDVSGADAVIAVAHSSAVTNLNFDRLTDKDSFEGSQTADSELTAKYQYYATRDERIVLLAATEHKFWDAFCQAVGRPDLMRYKNADAPSDWGRFEGLRSTLQTIFATKTLREWMDFAVAQYIPIGPVNRLRDLPDDPQLCAREILLRSTHPEVGDFVYVGTPAMIEGQPFEIYRQPPELGEHTVDVLEELGCSPDEIEALRESGAI